MTDWCSDTEDEKNIMAQTWNRVEQQLFTNGFRDGALVGEEKQFQNGFDKGYADGYQKGYELGVKAGQERIFHFITKNNSTGSEIITDLRKSLKNSCSECCQENK